MQQYVLTVWLIYAQPGLQPEAWTLPDLHSCLEADKRWHANVTAWRDRMRAYGVELGGMSVSTCEPLVPDKPGNIYLRFEDGT